MKKIVFLSMILLIISCLSAVTWQIALIDSYGDGWNGGKVTVFVNGSAVLTDITLPSGYGPVYHDFTVADGDEITTDYTAGSYGYENEYQIIDHNGTVIATQGAGSTTPGDITTAIVASVPAGIPAAASNPSPAHNAIGVALDGNLTWDFGASTDAYDLWFGPVGSMVQVEDGVASGFSGSYTYSGLTNDTQYSWRVDTISNASGITTTGPVWTFRSALPAGMVQIGTGSLTTLNLPLNPNFGYTYSQTIYLQSEISISGQRIEKLYFNWNGLAAGTNTKDWTIFMGHTTKTAFSTTTDWVPYADLTQVFNSVVNLPASPGWIEIILTTPFTYNNSDNLVIAVNETTSGYDSSAPKFFGTSFVANRGLRLQNDSSAYNPATPAPVGWESPSLVAGIANIKLQFGEIPTVPTFAYSPASLTFNNVVSGTSSGWQSVTVSNLGQGTLNLDSSDLGLIGTNSGDFDYDTSSLPAALNGGDSVTIPVLFNAPGVGTYTATLRITYDSIDYDVSLTGTSVAPFVNMSNGSTTLAEGEVWNFYDSGGVAGQYANNENFTYTFNPPAGYRCIVEFSVFNTESNYDFLELYDGVDTSGSLIGDYSGTTVPPAYTAIVSGSLTFRFTSDGSGLRDGWAATISTEELPETPTFFHSPASLAFPTTISGGASIAQNVTVTNIGGGTLSLRAEDLRLSGDNSEDFSFDGVNLPADLTTGQSVVIPVIFTPQSAGDKTATLVITYASVDYEVALTGYAYPDNYVFEGFDSSTFPPAGWANPGTWSRSTTTVFAGTGSAYKYGTSSSPYILSTPKLDIANGDHLMFMGRVSSTSATLDIIYSQNRSDWTVLQTLTAPTANTWLQVDVELSPILGSKASEGYYLGFRANSTYVSYYIDNVVMPPIVLEAPEAVTLSSPANAATNQSILPTLSWTAPTTGGVPTGYNVYLDTVDGSTLFASNVTSPYTLTTPLDWGETYYWTVKAFNAAGTGDAPAARSFTVMSDPTIYDLPYSVDFGTVSGDWPVAGWSQLSGLYPTPTGTNAQWVQDDWLKVTTPANKAAKINIYGTTRYGWLVTPPIAIPADGYELKFDAGLVIFGGTTPPTGTQEDDRFMVIMSDTPTMTNPTILREWNNTGSPWVFNDIPHIGANYTIPLTGVTGTKYFAFYGESTVSGNGDNDLMVDNILIRQTPTAPIFAIDPESKDFGLVELDNTVEASFTISNTGGATLEIDSEDITITGEDAADFVLSPITEDISLTAGQTAQITVSFTPTTEGDKTAALQITDNSGAKAVHDINLSGKGVILNTVPYAYGFSSGWGDWIVVNDGQTNQWHVGAHDDFEGTSAAYVSKDGGTSWEYDVTAESVSHFYQDFAFPADATDFILKFDWLCNGEGSFTRYDYLKVSIVDLSVMPLPGSMISGGVFEFFNLSTSVQTETIALPDEFAGTSKRIVFTWRNDSSVGNQPPAVVDNIRLLIDDGVDYADIDNGEVELETEIEPEEGIIFNPSIHIANLSGGGTVSVSAGYADADLPNAGLSLSLSGANFSGATITINHNLGFSPEQIAYKILPGEWVIMTPTSDEVVSWDATSVVFSLASKAAGDLVVVFPTEAGATLPVNLSSFTAMLTSEMNVNILWTVESETNHSGYNVLRSEVNELITALTINSALIQDGETNGTQIKYQFLDNEVYQSATYYYWLESVSLAGEIEYYGPLTVTILSEGDEPGIPEIPLETKLFAAFPNPFNPSTNLRYSMKDAGDVRIDIYNLKGQMVRSFVNSHDQPGYYQVSWDGRDAGGRAVSTGVYFYRMVSGRYSSTKKMVLAK